MSNALIIFHKRVLEELSRILERSIQKAPCRMIVVSGGAKNIFQYGHNLMPNFELLTMNLMMIKI